MSPLRWIRGWLCIRVEGAGPERFFNVCRRRNLAVWRIRRIDPTTLTCCVRPGALAVLRAERRRIGCRVRVLDRGGLPFGLAACLKRWTLPAAALLWAALLLGLSSRVWSISVTGCERLEERTVLDLAERCGFRVGVRRTGRAEMEQIRHTVLQQCHELSFFTINYRGSHAEIAVRERDPAQPDDSLQQPCDLVAGKTGIVSEILITEGTPAVKAGDTVLPDTVLAYGIRTSAFGEVTPVHAGGKITLRTWPTVTVSIPKTLDAALPTGREATRWSLIIGKKRINLYFIEKSPYVWYDKVIENRRLDLGRGYWLPVWLRRETYLEAGRQTCPVDREKAAALLEARCRQLLLAEPGREPVTVRFQMEENEYAYIGILKAECREPAGIERAPAAGKEE